MKLAFACALLLGLTWSTTGQAADEAAADKDAKPAAAPQEDQPKITTPPGKDAKPLETKKEELPPNLPKSSTPQESMVKRHVGKPGDVPADLKETIRTAIKMVEEKKYAEFLERFTRPREKEVMKELGEWDNALKGFGKDEASPAMLLKVLQAVEKLDKAEMTPDGKFASFTFDEAICADNRMTFAKVDNTWYLVQMDLETIDAIRKAHESNPNFPKK